MKRVLHLVRTTLPDHAVGPGDRVVYVEGAPAPAGAITTWRPAGACNPDHLSSDELCDLIFEYDTIAVW